MNINSDQNGAELSIGDHVECDGEGGTIVRFGGLGAFVKMDVDSEVIDWPFSQIELG